MTKQEQSFHRPNKCSCLKKEQDEVNFSVTHPVTPTPFYFQYWNQIIIADNHRKERKKQQKKKIKQIKAIDKTKFQLPHLTHI